ncbi:two-component system response regulator [Bdellovibrionota bacterium]
MANVILLADDSQTIQKVLKLALADSPYDLRIVDNSDEVVPKALESGANLVLVDVSLPEKGGYQICEEIKAHSQLRKTSVVLLYGAFENIDEGRFKAIHADGKLKKPFSTQELFRLFRKLLTDKKELHERVRESDEVREAVTDRSLEEVEALSHKIISELGAEAAGMEVVKEEPMSTPRRDKQEKKLPDFSYLDEEIVAPSKEKREIEERSKITEDVFTIPPVVSDARAPLSSVADTDEARKMIREMATEIIERVAWEVIPQVAETVIKQEIKKLLEEEAD